MITYIAIQIKRFNIFCRKDSKEYSVIIYLPKVISIKISLIKSHTG